MMDLNHSHLEHISKIFKPKSCQEFHAGLVLDNEFIYFLIAFLQGAKLYLVGIFDNIADNFA